MKRRGSSSTEFILTMLLLILFSLATISLVVSASGAYRGSEETIEDESQIRVAQSYLYTKFRQNMEVNRISVESLPGVEEKGIVITDTVLGEDIKTIIFHHEGYLREGVFLSNTEFNPTSSYPIASLEKLNINMIENKGIDFETISVQGKSFKGFIALIPK